MRRARAATSVASAARSTSSPQQLAAHAEHLSQKQIEPLEARLDEMHAQVAQIAKRTQDTSAVFKPLVQKLQEISDRLAGLGAEGVSTPLSERLGSIEERIAGLTGKTSDPRGLQTQLDAILSRLEVLKGRSIDPGRLNELFDRVEFAVRSLPEERSAQDAISPERLERLERKVADAAAGASSERFVRLEKKLDEIGRAFSKGEGLPAGVGDEVPASEELIDLRSEISALRRELRSMPAAAPSEPNLGELMRAIAKRLDRLPQDTPAALAGLEAQIARIAQVLDDPASGPAGFARIQASLKTIEKRLDDTRRSLGYRPPREVDAEVSDEEREAAAGLARSLSEDVSSLKTPAEASERKNSDAIDAVQDTLEAVVKRMAFLERDADAGTASRSGSGAENRSASRAGRCSKRRAPEPPHLAPASAPCDGRARRVLLA